MAPRYAQGQKAVPLTVEAIFNGVKSIIESGREKEFIAACRERDARVKLPVKDVNFVKDFLFERRVHEALPSAAKVVDSDECTQYGG